MVSEKGRWSQRRADGLRGGQMVSKEGKWSQRRANGLKGGQMVSKEGKWSQRRAMVSKAVLPLMRSSLVLIKIIIVLFRIE